MAATTNSAEARSPWLGLTDRTAFFLFSFLGQFRFKLYRNRLAIATLCLGFAGTSALVPPAYADEMAKGMMAEDGMMADPMIIPPRALPIA